MLEKMELILIHPIGENNPLHVFVKKSGREILQNSSQQGSDHSLRAIPGLSRPDFPQNPCSIDFFRIIAFLQ